MISGDDGNDGLRIPTSTPLGRTSRRPSPGTRRVRLWIAGQRGRHLVGGGAAGLGRRTARRTPVRPGGLPGDVGDPIGGDVGPSVPRMPREGRLGDLRHRGPLSRRRDPLRLLRPTGHGPRPAPFPLPRCSSPPARALGRSTPSRGGRHGDGGGHLGGHWPRRHHGHPGEVGPSVSSVPSGPPGPRRCPGGPRDPHGRHSWYSRLSEEQLPAFSRVVMGSFSDVLARYDANIEYRNTWGDAILAVVSVRPRRLGARWTFRTQWRPSIFRAPVPIWPFASRPTSDQSSSRPIRRRTCPPSWGRTSAAPRN